MPRAWNLCVCLLLVAAAPDTGRRDPPSDAGVPRRTAVDSTLQTWRSLHELQLHGDLWHRVEKPVVLVEGPARIEIRSGWLIPVFSGRFAGEWERGAEDFLREERRRGLDAPELPDESERGSQGLVGFAWTGGEGTLTVALDDRADAQALANRMVRVGGADRARGAEIAGKRSITTAISEGLVVGLGPEVAEAYLAQSAIRDPFEVVVYADSDAAKAAARRARELVRSRLSVYDALDLDVGGQVAWDRLAVDRGGEPVSFLADFATADRYAVVSRGGGDPAQDRWLAVLGDQSGTLDVRRGWRVQTMGLGGEGAATGLIGGVAFPLSVPADPASLPLPPVRVEPRKATSRVLVTPIPGNLNLKAEITSRLRIAAIGGPISWFDLEIPQAESVPGTWKLEFARTLDGRDLIGATPTLTQRGQAPPPDPKPAPGPDPNPTPRPKPPPLADRIEPEWPRSRVRLFLPEPLAAGAELTIELSYTDTWPLSNRANCAGAERPMGTSSGLQRYLPSFANGQAGGAWPFDVKVGVPAGSGFEAAVGGDTARVWDEGGWTLTQAADTNPALWPTVSVGRWHSLAEPATADLPAVRVHMFNRLDLPTFGPEIRRVVQYYEGWLPKYPVGELEVFESPAGCGGFVWIAPHGMVSVSKMVLAGQVGVGPDESYFEHGILAHEIAHQYWGHVAEPGNMDDFWLAETMAESYACMYVGAAFGPQACAERVKNARNQWERTELRPWQSASLTGAYRSPLQPAIVYRYGPYVMHEMLRRRVGVETYFVALDVMLREHGGERITTERLQDYLSRASGQDLGDFFDYWIHVGDIPAVSVDATVAGTSLTGEITSDVPFGTFDVPLIITDDDGEREVWVDVVDGAASFTAPVRGKVKLKLDPTGMILARSRSVKLNQP